MRFVKYIIGIVLLFLVYDFFRCSKKINLPCDEFKTQLIHKMTQEMNADSILILSGAWRPEIYMDCVKSINFFIYNPSTQTLDFKEINNDVYFENYQNMESLLKEEVRGYFEHLVNGCDISHFDEVNFVFRKPKVLRSGIWIQYYISDTD